MKIAIIGWGSLFYDLGQDDNKLQITENWKLDGPMFPIEFARISGVLKGKKYLSLVINPGSTEVRTFYSTSCFENLSDAINNLRNRENSTNNKIIGFYAFINNEMNISTNHLEIIQRIKQWNIGRSFDAVIWTDLRNNFLKEFGMDLSEKNAVLFLKSLKTNEIFNAYQYIINTPQQIATDYRPSLEAFIKNQKDQQS